MKKTIIFLAVFVVFLMMSALYHFLTEGLGSISGFYELILAFAEVAILVLCHINLEQKKIIKRYDREYRKLSKWYNDEVDKNERLQSIFHLQLNEQNNNGED